MAGSSGQMARGFDVNKFPLVEEAEDGGALSSSPNNSAASSFQMDFCMYSGGHKKDFGNGNGNETEGERGSSRFSDEDENGCTRKKLRLSKEQSAFLEESFKEHNTLNPKQKLALAKQLNLRPRQVEVWFQNRRARTKLKQTEVDCEYLKRCCETLTEENRRLHNFFKPLIMETQARPLNDAPSRNPINKGIEILFDGLNIQAIKTGGPSGGGKGHEFTDAQTLGVTKSGPSPGEGH
ncbi:homeobox-leucine zipper protein HOX27-like [Pistacia vera]|uniref:homeobox-leucine zipper protein HOX27-like n=1 Tax=Pistacia vera TaxID=55513 RepID=UPI0012631A10|nr:homeobox-leucine zipper protein HOX27-like [Pistacia vera]